MSQKAFILVVLVIASASAQFCNNPEIVEQVPYPPSCRSFILCIFGNPLVIECPEGNGYEQIWIRGFCEEGNPETCEPGPVTTTTLPPPSPTPPTEGGVCQGVNLGLRAHPDYCWKYIWCFFGFGFAYECPETTIFSARTNLCLRGNRDTCTFSLRPTGIQGMQGNQF